MIRKTLITFLMGTLLVAAASTGTSLPVLLLMGALILLALYANPVRDEQQE